MSPRAHGRAIQLVTVWSGSTPEGGNNKIDDKSSKDLSLQVNLHSKKIEDYHLPLLKELDQLLL